MVSGQSETILYQPPTPPGWNTKAGSRSPVPVYLHHWGIKKAAPDYIPLDKFFYLILVISEKQGVNFTNVSTEKSKEVGRGTDSAEKQQS